VILNYLFAGADELANLTVGKALTDQHRNPTLLRIETCARCHDDTFSLVNVARQFHAFAAIKDSSAQKQRAQMVFHGSLADAELPSNFLVATAFNEQVQDLLIAGCDFDLIKISHGCASDLP
jgi:hypothetical protein